MKKRKVLRVISVILAFVILLLNIPASAFSVETEMAVTSNNSEEPDNYATDDEIFILEEDTSKRGRFEKHYLCSDGSYFSVTYPESVHYLTVDNQWEDIDLTPEYDTATGKYIKSSGAFGYSFGESGSNTNMVEIHSGEYTISWGLEIATEAKENGSESVSHDTPEDKETILPVSCVKAEISKERYSDNNSGKRYITDSKAFVLSDTSTKIKYSNYTEDCSISLEYTVYQDKIEEDIIINEKDAESFSMSMNIGNLVPVVNTDGSVFLTDEEGTVIFRIGIPYMVDSAFEVCRDISVKAEKTGTRCIITYSPDRTWMNSSDRVYPVVLDPSVSTNDYVSNIEDTYVEENSTVNHSSEQYLYINRNGNNRRKAIVRINQLPIVDEAMPIISAHLVLTAQSESTDYIDMKASYLDPDLDFEDYDYNISAFGNYSFVEYCCFEDGNLTVDFDVSSHIYSMYEDAEWDEEHGYDYNGDFIIGFEYESDTSYVPPFYSSEYTGVANRPKLIIRYGYSLPAGILNNNVYSFMNFGSACYMSVNGTNPGNNSNIYQLLGNGDGAELFQKFKLEYVSSTGGYLLRSMVSSSGYDKVVSINRGTSGVSENMNIRLSSPGDSIGQEWLIVPVDYYEFKIVPRANMSLAITAYGNSNGSNTGTSYNSSGNIFVKEYDIENNNQRWYIDDSDGEGICTDILRSVIETGTYYVSNYYSGKYLHRNTNTVNCARDKKAVLGENTVRWKIVNLGDGYCTIQRADLPGYYLARDVNSNNGVKVIYSSSETVADKCKWTIRLSSIGCLVKNFNGKYLTYNSSDSTVTLNNLSSSGTDAYRKQQWRIVEEANYTELSNYSVPNMEIEVGVYGTPIINKSPSYATWATPNDFIYEIQSSVGYGGTVTIYESPARIYGTVAGKVSIKAIHKVTNRQYIFTVEIIPLLEKTADYSLPSDIKQKLLYIRTSISQVNASSLNSSEKSEMIHELELQEDLIRADYILTGNNYLGSYAQSVISGFNYVIDHTIETVSDDLYRVVANRLLVLYGLEWSETSLNPLRYYLDEDCKYNEWTDESQRALNWYYLATPASTDFFNHEDSGITPLERTLSIIGNLQVYRYRHDSVKRFVATSLSNSAGILAYTEVTVKYGEIGYGRVDIAQAHSGGTYFWEVKPNKVIYYNGGRGTAQLQNYCLQANTYNNVFKGNDHFSPNFSAGYPINTFYLEIPCFDNDGMECLKVSPSPYYSTIPFESGLILYEPVDSPDGQYQTYQNTETQLNLINTTATIASQTIIQYGVSDLVCAMAFTVVEGVAMCLLVMYAPSLASGISQIMSGTASGATITAIQEAIAAGSVVITSVNPYTVGAVCGLTY